MFAELRRRVLFVPLGVVVALVPLLGVHDAARANAPPGRYTPGIDTADGTHWVLDNQTGLTWKRDEEPGTFTWASAKTQCASPWRLPTNRELQSIVDETNVSSPAIDPAFTSAGTFVWSSTPGALAAGTAWSVSFQYGASHVGVDTVSNVVRCVR